MRFAYYPGCVPEDSCKELDISTNLVAKTLGIELVRLKDATCCGAGVVQDVNEKTSLALNARTFAMAEKLGLDIMTICSTCQLHLSKSNKDLKENSKRFREVNEILSKVGMKYEGKVQIKHFLWVLVGDFGLEELGKRVEKKLSNLNVAPFYGCQLLRPSVIHNFEDPDKPTSLERLIQNLGAKVVEYDGKKKCCGFPITFVNEEASMKMASRNLLEAKERGADCLVTPCPLCHINLDTYQGRAERIANKKIGLPILHLSQLVGLALGISPNKLKLQKHLVSTKELVDRLKA